MEELGYSSNSATKFSLCYLYLNYVQAFKTQAASGWTADRVAEFRFNLLQELAQAGLVEEWRPPSYHNSCLHL